MSQGYPGQFGASAPVVGMGPIISPYGGYKGDVGGDWPPFYPPSRDESSAKEFSLRLLCRSANLGGVIGKGGVIIKQIRQESGAFIKVDSTAAEDDSIILISAKEVSTVFVFRIFCSFNDWVKCVGLSIHFRLLCCNIDD